MRILAVNSFISLDGVMQSPGGPDEDPTGGFTHGGRGVNYFDDEMMEQVSESGPYELLLGRGTYEIFAAHWPYDEGPIADQLNSTRKHVASTTLERVDEYRLWIFPVVLGTGKRFFGDGTIPAGLKLVDSKASKTGVTINTYEPAGDVNPGSFEFDEPTDAEVERRRRLAAQPERGRK